MCDFARKQLCERIYAADTVLASLRDIFIKKYLPSSLKSDASFLKNDQLDNAERNSFLSYHTFGSMKFSASRMT